MTPKRLGKLPIEWRKSVLFGQEGLRLRNWWKRGELWEEIFVLMASDQRLLERARRGVEKERQGLNRRIANHVRATRAAYARMNWHTRVAEGVQRRQVYLYRRIRQAEGAWRYGKAFMDLEEMRRVVDREVKRREGLKEVRLKQTSKGRPMMEVA